MSDLRRLLPLFQDLDEKRKVLDEAVIALNSALRNDGFTLSWDVYNDRYVVYPLPQALDGTYQMGPDKPPPHTPYHLCCVEHYPSDQLGRLRKDQTS